MKCSICAQDMIEIHSGFTAHPGCIRFDAPEDAETDPYALTLKRELTEVIRWADAQSPRSAQAEIGPSEIGTPCDRRLTYRLAAVPAVNLNSDPWAAIVGTAIHAWLEKAVIARGNATGSWSLVSETPVRLSELVKGHSDLYHRDMKCVVDYKTVGPDGIKKVRASGPIPEYVVQIQCYGYGYELLGMPVERVALAFFPRAGWLKDLHVWTAPYDRQVALNALKRLETIATAAVHLDVLGNPHRFEQVAHYSSNSCAWCPWYQADRNPERGADATGCPGR